jgi:hypothetical protein
VFLVLSAVVFSYVLSFGLKERLDSSLINNPSSSDKVIQTAGELSANADSTTTNDSQTDESENLITDEITPTINIQELFGLPINLLQDQIGGSISQDQDNELILDEEDYTLLAVANENDKIILIEVTFKQIPDCNRYDLDELTASDQANFVNALGIETESQINYDIRISCQQTLEDNYFKVTVSK